MSNVWIVKSSTEVEHCITRLDVAEESVTQPLALTGSLHQPGDVGDVEEGGHLAGGLVVLHQPVPSLVWHRHTSLVGVYRTEGEVLGSGHGGLGQHVEEGGLPNIRQTNYTTLQRET